MVAERAKGLTREEAEKLVDERTASLEKRLLKSRAEGLASDLAKTPEEKELILHHYENSIVPSGSIEEDIENAYALANRKKLRGTLSELKRAAFSKKTRQADSGPGAPPQEKKELKISKEARDIAEFSGKSPEEAQKELDKRK